MDISENFSIANGNCINCSIRHFNETFHSFNNQILVINFNIQSFDRKFDEFTAFLDNINLSPHIMILSETWFSPSTCKEILGYKSYHLVQELGGEGVARVQENVTTAQLLAFGPV